jgi:hypothetical protein
MKVLMNLTRCLRVIEGIDIVYVMPSQVTYGVFLSFEICYF